MNDASVIASAPVDSVSIPPAKPIKPKRPRKKYSRTDIMESRFTSARQDNYQIFVDHFGAHVAIAVAVFRQAKKDLQHSNNDRLAYDARAFFQSEMFDAFCGAMGINEDAVRSRLHRMMPNADRIRRLA